MIDITVKNGVVIKVARNEGDDQELLTEGSDYTVFYDDLDEEGDEEE